jgi:hypothetical protein
MDYTKKGGGTRIHDPLVHRSLMTGVGQTVHSNRSSGSKRAMDVLEKVPPEAKHAISDPALAEAHRQGTEEVHTPFGTAGVAQAFPLRGSAPHASSQSHMALAKNPQPQAQSLDDAVSPSARQPGPRRIMRVPGAVQGGPASIPAKNSVR